MAFDIPYTPPQARPADKRWLIAACVLVVVSVGIGLVWFRFAASPASFPTQAILTVPEGSSISSVAIMLEKKHVIQSVLAFKVLAKVEGGKISAGDYSFEKPASVLTVAYNFTHQVYGVTPTKVTFPEGYTALDMANALIKVPDFDAKGFYTAAVAKEGYLFPDTYFVTPGTKPEALVAQMRTEFDLKIARVTPAILASGHTEADIVTMASILEREAKTAEDRRIVAGILWARLKDGMPLQVDAAIAYAVGKDSYVPTAKDLEVDSPYNTYKHTGLTPTPISNPGLDALMAAASPATTSYVYYLSDKNGVMHYAATYEQHQANIKKYL